MTPETIRALISERKVRRDIETNDERRAFRAYLDDIKAIQAQCQHKNQESVRDDIDTPELYMTHLNITCKDCGKVLR